jgi:hypothetical protein
MEQKTEQRKEHDRRQKDRRREGVPVQVNNRSAKRRNGERRN